MSGYVWMWVGSVHYVPLKSSLPDLVYVWYSQWLRSLVLVSYVAITIHLLQHNRVSNLCQSHPCAGHLIPDIMELLGILRSQNLLVAHTHTQHPT